jgi:hypothetical protein
MHEEMNKQITPQIQKMAEKVGDAALESEDSFFVVSQSLRNAYLGESKITK